MKLLLVVASLALLSVALAVGSNTITYEDSNGNVITEDLDEPIASTYGADINQQKFMLYTRASGTDTPQELKNGDANILKNSNFNPKNPTKVLIHGWQCSYTAESVQMLKDAYLAKGEYNVIICDYEKYNAPYVSACANAKSIGENIGAFISFLLTQGLNIKELHIIGHSLGAHISGFAASAITPKTLKAPRVTGLDPAGPNYENTDVNKRLNSGVAVYVDIVHTSTALGIKKAIGTVDFFVKGGSNQPSCTQAMVPGACDHSTSYKYFCETIANNKQYPARSCKSESDAQSNDKGLSACTASSAYLGENAINTAAAGLYYVS